MCGSFDEIGGDWRGFAGCGVLLVRHDDGLSMVMYICTCKSFVSTGLASMRWHPCMISATSSNSVCSSTTSKYHRATGCYCVCQ
jgi:hypothetical protein